MSLFGMFDIGKSALFASQTALNVISNNIANVNTPGYNRQEVILEVANPVQLSGDYVGRGVTDAGIRRHYDKFIHLQLIDQNMSFGSSYVLDQTMSHIEQIFNEAQGIGLADSLNDYINAWQEVSANAEGQPQRISLLQKANTMLQTAKQMEGDMLDTLKHVNEDIVNVISNVNTITSNIATVNEKIAEVEAGLDVDKASFFRDERDRMLNDLARLTDYTWYENNNGFVTVLIGGKSVVTSERSFDFTTSTDIDGNTNVALRGQDMNSVFQQGELGGLIAVRDDIEDNSLYGLRKLVAAMVNETNIEHNQGFGLDGNNGYDFFNELQLFTRDYSTAGYVDSTTITDPNELTLDEYNIVFSNIGTTDDYDIYNVQTGAIIDSGTGFVPGGTISITDSGVDLGIDVVIDGVLADGNTFFISPLRGAIQNSGVAITDTNEIAAALSAADLPGDNGRALSIATLNQSNLGELSSSNFESYYSGIVSSVGIMSAAASDSLTYDDNLLFELQKKRESISGVSLDEEAANMLRYQRSFEAGARILKVTDELLQTIMNL